METTSLDYGLFKTVVASGSLKVYWMLRTGGYSLYANTDRYFLFAAAIGADATDFELTKDPANEVSSLDDVKVKGMLDQGVPAAPPSGNVGQNVPPSATLVGGKDPDGKVKMAELDANGYLKTTAIFNGLVAAGLLADIVKESNFTITLRDETVITGLTHTVTAGKSFYATLFGVSTDCPSTSIFRLKVNGTTKVTLIIDPTRPSNSFAYPIATKLAVAGDVITATVDASVNRGIAYATFQGLEN